MEKKLYRCTKGGCNARGYADGKGFVVLEGSRTSDHTAPSFELASPGYFKLRKRLIADGLIRDDVLQEDYHFSSPTAAAAVMVGWTISGNSAWEEMR